MSELWLPVPSYEGKYEASNLGRVRSLTRQVNSRYGLRTLQGRILKQVWDREYYIVGLGKGSEHRWHVHRVIAATFLGPCPKGLIVLHGVNGAKDNSVENLSYGTHRDNELDKVRDGTVLTGERHHKTRLTAAQVKEIRETSGVSQQALADRYGVQQGTIWNIIHRKTWAHLPAQ